MHIIQLFVYIFALLLLLFFPDEGIMCELLWSDPQPMMGRSPSKRGVGCQFGPDVTKNFLEHNNLDYIVRSHEVFFFIYFP